MGHIRPRMPLLAPKQPKMEQIQPGQSKRRPWSPAPQKRAATLPQEPARNIICLGVPVHRVCARRTKSGLPPKKTPSARATSRRLIAKDFDALRPRGILYSLMTRDEQSYGIIPLFRSGGQCMHLLIQHKKGHWGFPKGHPKEGEASFDTALRELHEETGINDCTILPGLSFSDTYTFTDEGGDVINKTVTYYLGAVHDPRVEVDDPSTEKAG